MHSGHSEEQERKGSVFANPVLPALGLPVDPAWTSQLQRPMELISASSPQVGRASISPYSHPVFSCRTDGERTEQRRWADLRAPRPETRLWESRTEQLTRPKVILPWPICQPLPVCSAFKNLTSSLAFSDAAFQKEEDSSP